MPRKKESVEDNELTTERSSRSRKPTEKALALAQTEKFFLSALKPPRKSIPPTVTSPTAATSKSIVFPAKKEVTSVSQLQKADSDNSQPETVVRRRGRPRKTDPKLPQSNQVAKVDPESDQKNLPEDDVSKNCEDSSPLNKSIQLIIEEDSCSSPSGSQDSGPFYGTIPISLELDTQVETHEEVIETTVVDDTDFMIQDENSVIAISTDDDATNSNSVVLENEKDQVVAELQRLTTKESDFSIHPLAEKPLKKYPPARSKKIPISPVDPRKVLLSTPQQIDLPCDTDMEEINVELSFKPKIEVAGASATEKRGTVGRPRKSETIEKVAVQPKSQPTRKSLRSLRKDPSQEEAATKDGDTTEIEAVSPSRKVAVVVIEKMSTEDVWFMDDTTAELNNDLEVEEEIEIPVENPISEPESLLDPELEVQLEPIVVEEPIPMEVVNLEEPESLVEIEVSPPEPLKNEAAIEIEIVPTPEVEKMETPPEPVEVQEPPEVVKDEKVLEKVERIEKLEKVENEDKTRRSSSKSKRANDDKPKKETQPEKSVEVVSKEVRKDSSRRDETRHDKRKTETSSDEVTKKDESRKRTEKSSKSSKDRSSSSRWDEKSSSDSRKEKDRSSSKSSSSYHRDDKHKSRTEHSDREKSSRSSSEVKPKPVIVQPPPVPKPKILKDVDVLKMDEMVMEREKERIRARKLQKEQKNKEKASSNSRTNSPKPEEIKEPAPQPAKENNEIIVQEPKPETEPTITPDVKEKVEEISNKTESTSTEEQIAPAIPLEDSCLQTPWTEQPFVEVPKMSEELLTEVLDVNPHVSVEKVVLEVVPAKEKKDKTKKDKPKKDKLPKDQDKSSKKDKTKRMKKSRKYVEDYSDDSDEKWSRSSSKSSKKGGSRKSKPAEEPPPPPVERAFEIAEPAMIKIEIPLPMPAESALPSANELFESKPEDIVTTADSDINNITALMSSNLELVGPTNAECSAAIEYEMSDQIEKMSIVQAVDGSLVKEEQVETNVEMGVLVTDIPMPEESVKAEDLKVESQIEDNDNLRRSSRIKTISSSKQRTVGHGLVRDRDKLLKMMGIDDSNLSLNSSAANSEHSSPNTSVFEDSTKPMKVKSRWRRSSELEMGLVDDTDEYMPSDELEPPSKLQPEEEVDPEKVKENERIVEEQLKLFQHINENIHHCDRNVSKETRKMTCDCFLTKEECERGELGCGEDCLNRLLMIECGQRCVVGDRCTNKRFQKQQNSEVHVFRTEKKGCGIKATRVILPGDFVMEYVGEVLNSDQFEKRAHEYSKEKNKHYYFMALRSDCIIDATLKGNVSRFINHSCDPNAETQKWTINGELRIGFFSLRTILPGEEIVFDYQFQRYGKQAQKCYCEAENCRGWIGEEPDSEESEIEEEEYDEEAEKTSLELPVDAIPKIAAPKPPKKVKVKVPKPDAAKRSRKIRKDLIDDVGLDEEIDTLVRTGLKNQVHTLKLSRLMVRAEAIAVRRRLLNLLLHGELPCLRLFLDYYGLRLLHGWMCGITSTDVFEILKFKLNLLEVLEVLPITNKTTLKDSKVISTVESWITKKTAGAKKEFFTQEPSPINDSSSNSSDLPVVPVPVPLPVPPPAIDSEFLKNMPNLLKQSVAFVQEMDVDKLKQIMESCGKLKEQEREKELSEAAAALAQPEISSAKASPPDDENETLLAEKINTLCRKLLAAWETLKEVFKIPKKERIEQMKEHEREADMRYKALGLADEEDQNQQRYKSVPWRERRQIESFQKSTSHRSGDTRERGLSKHQRRHLFEVRVAQEEAEKRKQEMWILHETTCIRFGLNPRQVAPQDIPGMMNVYTEQYYTMDHRPIPTPPSHAFLKFKKPPLSTNPADYIIPAACADLPPMWKYGIDDRGRIYYYHIKIRISQWEPPIKLLPLNNEGGQQQDETASENETTDDDTSTTDTNDSSEEELDQKLQELKRAQEKRKQLIDQSDDVTKTIENLETSIADTDTDEIFGNSFLLDRTLEAIIPNSKKRRRKRDGLVQEKIISPRTEEDRAYGQMEMKRYRETKEKLRRRKEEARRKKAMTLEALALTSAEAEKSGDKDDDDEEDDATATSSILDAEDVDIEKVSKKKPIVDELEIFRKTKPRKHSNVYEEWKKQELKMKLEKRKSAKQGSSSKIAKRAKISETLGAIDYNSEEARKIKDKFRVAIAGVIVQHLGPYRKETCEIGKITNNEDFKHLARKLTHFVMLKELKHNHNTIRDLVVTDSVKTKAREFIKKYMAKYGQIYQRGANEPDFKD